MAPRTERHGPAATIAKGYESGDEDTLSDEVQKDVRQDSTVPRSPQRNDPPPPVGVENVLASSSSQATLAASDERRPSSILLSASKGYLRDSLPFPKPAKALRFNDDQLEDHLTISPPPTSSGSISPTAAPPPRTSYMDVDPDFRRERLLGPQYTAPPDPTPWSSGRNNQSVTSWLLTLPFMIAYHLAPLGMLALAPFIFLAVAVSVIFSLFIAPPALFLGGSGFTMIYLSAISVRGLVAIITYPTRVVIVSVIRCIRGFILWFFPKESGPREDQRPQPIRSLLDNSSAGLDLFPRYSTEGKASKAGKSTPSHPTPMESTESDSSENTRPDVSGCKEADDGVYETAEEDSPLPSVKHYQDSGTRALDFRLGECSNSLDFGTMSLGANTPIAAQSSSEYHEVATPGDNTDMQMPDQGRFTLINPSRSPDPSAMRGHLGSPLRTENMTPRHHRISSNMASALSGTPINSPLGESPSQSESPTRDGSSRIRNRSDSDNLRCCCLPLSHGTSLLCDRLSSAENSCLPSGQRAGRLDAENASSWRFGTWPNGRRLLSAARASLDIIAGEISQAPSPVFGSQQVGSCSPAISVCDTAEAGVLPGDDAANGTIETFGTTGQKLEFKNQPVSTAHIPSLSLSEEEPPPPSPSIRTPKRRRRMTVTPSPKKAHKSRNSFGIDHSYSPPEEMPKDDEQRKDEHKETSSSKSRNSSQRAGADPQRTALPYCTVLAARTPDEPDPSLYLGSPFSLLPQLTLAALPTCTHRPKLAVHNTDPPPDIVESALSLASSEGRRSDTITDLTAEAYTSTLYFQAVCPPGPTQYISRRLTNAVLLEESRYRQEVVCKTIVEISRAWGMPYLAKKFTQRLERRRERGLGVVRGDVDYDSDDDTPRSSFSSVARPSSTERVPEPGEEKEEKKLELEGVEQTHRDQAEDAQGQPGQTQSAGNSPQPSAAPEGNSSDPEHDMSVKDHRQDSPTQEPGRKISFTEPTKPTHEPDDILPSRTQKRSPPPLPPSYEGATSGRFDATDEDIAIAVRQEGSNTSTPISAIEGRRGSLALARKPSSLGWSPAQTKSTASLGVSAGQSVMGKLGLRNTIGARSRASTARRSVEEALFEKPGEQDEDFNVGTGEQRNRGLALQVAIDKGKGRDSDATPVLKKSVFRVKTPGQGPGNENAFASWKHRRASLNNDIDLKPLTQRKEVDEPPSPNSENVSPKTLVRQPSKDPPIRLPISAAEKKRQQKRKHKRNAAVALSEEERREGEMRHFSKDY